MCYHLKQLKPTIPGAKMKKETWFFIKYNNMPELQVIKKGVLGIVLKNDF